MKHPEIQLEYLLSGRNGCDENKVYIGHNLCDGLKGNKIYIFVLMDVKVMIAPMRCTDCYSCDGQSSLMAIMAVLAVMAVMAVMAIVSVMSVMFVMTFWAVWTCRKGLDTLPRR